MLQFLCLRCSRISTSVEGLRCPRCDGDGSGTVMAANSNSAVPEYGNESPGYYVTVEDESTQVSEEDLVPVEPTRDASTQVSEEDLVPMEPTREASTQTSDDDLTFQIAGSRGYENCLKSDEKVEDRHDKDNIPPPFSFCPRGNPSMNKCFQENSGTAISLDQQTPQSSNKLSRRRCKNCGRFFMKNWTFLAHLQNYCNPNKPYKCEECGRICRDIGKLLLHQSVHTGEKPFKCTQCDYASAWPTNLRTHLETRHWK